MAENVVSARQLSLQGMEAMQQGRWQEAEQLFGSAVESCPVDERARRGYAQVLWRRGARREAVKQLEEAVRLSADDPELVVQLGEMCLSCGDLEQAFARAEAALRSQRELARAWALRGEVLARKGYHQEALANYHRALSYQEHYPEVQLAVAEIYRLQGRPQRALATLDALADRYVTHQVPQQVLYLRGLALKHLGRYQDAVESLAAASQREAPEPELLFHLSEAQLLTGDPANARLTVLQALDLAPQHAPSHQLKAHIESRQGIAAAPHAASF